MDSLRSMEELAYLEIKQRILDGRLLPGARLIHRTLSEELGMSRVPLVLALRMLEQDGLVENTPGLGATVRRWTEKSIIDIYQIRTFQEALACRLCAERASSEDIDKIADANEAFRESYLAGDTDANTRADIEFHLAVVRGAHCPDLEPLLENICVVRASMVAFSISFGVPRLFFEGGECMHDAIVAAVREHDLQSAERAGREHVEASLTRNLKWIEETTDALQCSRGVKGGCRGYGT